MNEEDDLLQELAAHRRQDDAQWQATLARLGLSDDLLERYAAGQLTGEEQVELQSLATKDAEAATILAAYEPLAPAFQQSLLERLDALEPGSATDAGEGETNTGTTATVAEFPPRRARRPAFAIPAALAAGLLVALLLPTLLTGPRTDPLPDYVLRVSGMTAQLRADPTDEVEVRATSEAPVALQLAPGNQLRLLMTPATEAGEPVDTRLFLQSPAHPTPEALALDSALVRTAASGAIRIQATVGDDLLLPPGTSRLLVVVGRSDALPQADRLADLLGDYGGVDGGAWQAFALDLDLSE